VIDVQDVVRFLHERNGQSHTLFTLKDLVRKIDIYPETKLVSDLLEEFKRKKIKIAMVADEHGGFAGIVTLEDLLEEIVGEIMDDDDDESVLLEQPEPNRLLVRGRMEIDELNEQYSMAIPDEEYKTVGGFVFGEIGREPEVGDSIVFDECTYTVLEMDGHRVERIQIDSPMPFVAVSAEELLKLPQSSAIIVPHSTGN
jgi:putative hemolysin